MLSDVTFKITETNHFVRGPLSYTAHYLSAVLILYLLICTIFKERRKRFEIWITILNVAIVVLGTLADLSPLYVDYPVSYLTIAIVCSCLFYYIWMHLEFVHEHENALIAEQRIKIMMSQIQPHFLYNTLTIIQSLCLTDILRGDMGYDGVVITDAMEMDAIAQHFDKYDAAKLAINAGVDILLIPVDTTTKQGFAGMDTYISTLAAMADNGEISMEKINAAVMRILKLKAKNGLFTSYDSSDIESRVDYAVNHVGTKESRDREWEIAKKAMTLVRNKDNTLPLTKPNQKTVVLVPYDDETIPMDYAVRKLTADGKLPEGAAVEAYSYYKKGIDDMLSNIEGADNIVFMSEIYGAYALKNATAQMADTLADTIHENGGRFILMSVSLPYDVARFQKADAIMIAYLARSMPVDPGDKVKEMKQYGPNMPVALYMMFSAQDAPTAKLPINNPKELAHVYQKKASATGKCTIMRDHAEIGEIVPKITLFKPKYVVKGLEWTIEGNFKQDEFVIKDHDRIIVKVGIRILSKGSAFEINIDDGIDEITALACVLAIEGLLETEVLGTAVGSSIMSMYN